MTRAARANPPARSDAELVAAIASQELEALGTLFDRYASVVRRYFGRLGIAPSDVDDLVQATFLEVVRAAVRYDSAFAARAWLLGIATLIARRHRRSLARAIARVAAWAGNQRESLARTPADAFEATDDLQRVERAFARLSAKKREVLVMITLEGLSGPEVATLLGVPVQTVWTRLHHARRELRTSLGEDEP